MLGRISLLILLLAACRQHDEVGVNTSPLAPSGEGRALLPSGASLLLVGARRAYDTKVIVTVDIRNTTATELVLGKGDAAPIAVAFEGRSVGLDADSHLANKPLRLAAGESRRIDLLFDLGVLTSKSQLTVFGAKVTVQPENKNSEAAAASGAAPSK